MTSSTARPFTSAPDASKGLHSSIFKPPTSPSLTASSTALQRLSSGSRKRSRADSTQTRRAEQSQLHRNSATHSTQTPSHTSGEHNYSDDLVNERYRLAGGFDTPSYKAAVAGEQEEPTLEELGRRTRDQTYPSDGYFPTMPLSGPLARERNGNARIAPTGPDKEQGTSWALFAVGLVSKVFTFGTGVIKGFYSGGGEGYSLPNQQRTSDDYDQPGCSTPVPGSWMDESTISYPQHDEPDLADSVHRPSNKRRQTDKDAWVMVSPMEGSSKRRMSSNLTPRAGISVRPPPASRAGSRRSLAPTTHRRQSSYTHATGSPSHDRRASIAPTRSPGSTYFSPEAERHVKRQAKQDLKINNISRQLEDLIRQGQEALGTKVEVESTDTDEGFAEDW